MKPRLPWLVSAAFLTPWLPLRGVTATGLSSFEGLEQPAQRYVVADRSFVADAVTAITDEGGGTFKMALRYGAGGWEGDRDTGNRDRQRAEVKGLGPHQKIGETFEYATTWRIDAGFHGTNRFFHIFQLKATEGDDGAPLITMSLAQDPHRASVRYWSGTSRGSKTAREFSVVPGEWTSVRIRVKTSFEAEGEVLVSVNGDPFVGVVGLPVFRTDARDYRPKWGMYRGVTARMNLSDDYVEHRAVSARNLALPVVDNVALESAARVRAAHSFPAALAWLEAQPASPERGEAAGAIGGLWAETDPVAAINWAWAQSGPDRARTLLRVYDRWQVRDVRAALNWLEQHAPSPDLDSIAWFQSTDTSFRHDLKDPTLAGSAGLIVDPKLRRTAYETALSRWARQPGEKPAAVQFAQTEAKLDAAGRAELAKDIAGVEPARGRGSE